jgi:hypothetical protein
MSNAQESECLINELEGIYLQVGWRGNPDLSNREREIKARLSELLSDKKSDRCLTDGSPVPPDHREIDPATGQQKGYVVLTPEERAKGWVRPYRDSYIHVGEGGHEIDPADRSKHGRKGNGCGALTRMNRAIAETYARDPKFYSGTFCIGCKKHFPLNEFKWADTDITVGE